MKNGIGDGGVGFSWKLMWDYVGEFWCEDAVKGSGRGVKMAYVARGTHLPRSITDRIKSVVNIPPLQNPLFFRGKMRCCLSFLLKIKMLPFEQR